MSGGEDLFGLVGYQLDGKYNVEAAVARGGFGVVYRATHLALLTSHAVKVLRVPPGLPAEMHERFLTQFVEEARIIAQFQHPAVVRVTDFGVSNMPTGEQSPWMVLEWLDGTTLGDDLNARRGHGGRTPRECLDLLAPVIDALAAAHDMGIAHRDIKPANIMLASEPSGVSLRGTSRRGGVRPTARVLDFGIAKIMTEGDDGPASGQTRTGSLMPAYSPRYASPEQMSGTRTGPWTDVHALGLILTEMLTDQAPYSTTDKLKLAMQVMSPTRPTPARFGVDVGPWEAVLAKALAITPADRYPNAGEFLAALEANVPTESHHVAASTVPVVGPPSQPWLAPTPPTPSTPPVDISTLRPSTAPMVPAQPKRGRSAAIVGAVLLCALVSASVIRVLTRTTEASSATAHTATTLPPTVAQPPAALLPSRPVAPTLTADAQAPAANAPTAMAMPAPEPPTAPERPPTPTRAPSRQRVVQAGRAPHARAHQGADDPAPAAPTHAQPAAPAPTPEAPTAHAPINPLE